MKMKLAMILGVILMSSIGLAALLTSYGVITGTANVNQSVLVDGKGTPESLTLAYNVNAIGGNTYRDEPHSLFDQADVPANVTINTTHAGPSADGIITTYYGALTLTKKTVNFSADVWDIPTNAETVEIEYTIVGNFFDARVTNNAKDDYVLIYYKDNSDRFNSPANGIYVQWVTGNLPYANDGNAGEYDYCATGEYLTCHGAKLWYIPNTAMCPNGIIDWSRASEFFFETELIQYNKEGNLTLYPQHLLDFGIQNKFHIATIPGIHTITTDVEVN